MATANLTTIAIERLAMALDVLAAERWDDLSATYAWIDADNGDLRLGTPPSTRVHAVAVTCLGTRLVDDRELGEGAVRVTVAASCCHAAALLRHVNGRIEHASSVDGVTVATLRQWAFLDPCVTCAPEQGSSARTRPDMATDVGGVGSCSSSDRPS